MGIIENVRKAFAPRKATDAPNNPRAESYKTSVGRPTVSYNNVIAAETAFDHVIIARMLTIISGAVQSVRPIAIVDPFSGETASRPTAAIKEINNLIGNPNDSMNNTQFMRWCSLNLACYGRVPFKVSTDIMKKPNGMYPLIAQFLTSKSDKKGNIVEYNYGNSVNSSSSERYRTRTIVENEKAQEAWIHEIVNIGLNAFIEGINCNVAGGSNAITPLRAIGLPTIITRELLGRAADLASGLPTNKHIVTFNGKDPTTKQMNSIKEHVSNSQHEDVGNVMFMRNVEIKIDTLNNDTSDIHSKIPMDDFTRVIAGAFGIPIPLLGIGAADAAKFTGNYAEARAAFWQDTIIPQYLVPICDGLTSAICPPGIIVVPDLDAIPAIVDKRVSMMKDLSTISFLTNDEKRALVDYATLNDEQRATIAQEMKPTTLNLNQGAK